MDTTITLNLPDDLREFVEERAASRGHGSPADFIQALLEAEQLREAKSRVDALLLEGHNSELMPDSNEWWESLEARIKNRDGKAPTP